MADKTIVALYEVTTVAQTVRDDLVSMGIGGSNVDLLTDSDINIRERLRGCGVPADAAAVYAEGVRRGSTLVLAEVDEADLDRALAVVKGYSPADVDELGTRYRASGWTGPVEDAEAYESTGVGRGSRTGMPSDVAAGGPQAGHRTDRLSGTMPEGAAAPRGRREEPVVSEAERVVERVPVGRGIDQGRESERQTMGSTELERGGTEAGRR
jgi:hypothetical protein